MIRPGFFVLAALLAAGNVHAEQTPLYLLAIGNNGLPPDNQEDGLRPLRYADDDAAAVFQFYSSAATEAYLLTVMDRETQRRFPGLAARSRIPSEAELRRTVTALRARLLADRAAGRQAQVVLFFSGHGSRQPSGAYLALSDAKLTQERLYDEVLAQLPAPTIHLVVDACYAEAVIRPRDAETSAAVVEVSAAEVALWNREKTLQRFPNVGAVIAAAATQQAHEWSAYARGVFTYQVLSGLRGAADVNADRKIEYSELQAYLAAANSGVRNPQARLEVIVAPPQTNMRAPLVDLNRFREVGWATGAIPASRFYIEQEDGQRLVDVHSEAGQQLQLALPPTRLALRTQQREAEFSLRAGQELSLTRLQLRPSQMTARGAIDSALRRGLFTRAYGPRYYQAYMDSVDGVTVPLTAVTATPSRPKAASKAPAWTALGTAAALTVAAAVTTVLALDARAEYQATDLERPADQARSRYDAFRFSAFATGGAALLAGGIGLWLWPWQFE